MLLVAQEKSLLKDRDFIANSAPAAPDLSLANLNIQASALEGELVDLTFDLLNNGPDNVNGVFRIGMFLSLDNVWSPDDTGVGHINTGFTEVGTTPGITGTILLHNGLPGPGPYTFFLVVDSDEEIAEGDETNNILSAPFEVLAVENPDECGFLKSYYDRELPYYPIVEELSDGYTFTEWQAIAGDDDDDEEEANAFKEINLRIDEYGNEVDYQETEVAEEGPVIPCVLSLTPEGNNQLTAVKIVDGQTLEFTETISLDIPSTGLGQILSAKAIPISDGFIVLGNYREITLGGINYTPFLLELDDQANLINTTLLTPLAETFEIGPMYADNLDRAYFILIQEEEINLLQANGDATFGWESTLVNDPDENLLRKIRWSPDENHLFIAILKDQKAVIRKISAQDASEVFEIVAGDVLSPNGVFTNEENLRDLVPSADGGVVFGYHYQIPQFDEVGYEYGKVDANGGLEWWYQLPYPYKMDARIATSDGGYLFTGTFNTTTTAVLKITSTGEMFPACSPGENEIDLALSVEATNVNGYNQANPFVTFTLYNEGPDVATEVQVAVDIPDGLVYLEIYPYTTDNGDFDWLESGIWKMDALPAGDSAVLVVYLQTLTAEDRTVFGQVWTADGQDVDSNTGNGASPTPFEDDEGVTVVHGDPTIINLSQQDSGLRQAKQFRMYPNPVSGEPLQVEFFTTQSQLLEISIFDVSGKRLQYHQFSTNIGFQQIQLDLNDLPTGVYWMMVGGNREAIYKN